jgi:hypothetical protein
MRWITDQQAAQIPAFEGLDNDQRVELISDATTAWRYIAGHPWAPDDEVRAYAAKQDIPPDRVTGALNLLRSTGRAYALDDTPITPLPEPPEPPQPAGGP